MDYSKNFSIPSTLAVLTLLFLSLFYVSTLAPFPPKSFFSFPINSSTERIELEGALMNASTEEKTVIITIINKAYVEPYNKTYPSMFDLFLESFWEGENTKPLMDHLLVVTMDQSAYERCNFRRLHCYRLVTDGADFTGEKLYMSDEFIKMMWRRTLFLMDVLKLGYNFIFTDTDVMWLRNPFLRLSNNKKPDLQISTDWFKGDPYSNSNPINTGFYFVKSNLKTIALFQIWYAMRKNSKGMKEQDVLAKMISDDLHRELGLKIQFLDTLYFGGFCSDDKRDVNTLVTVHANCCRSIEAKVADLKILLMDWKRFKKVQLVAGKEERNNVTVGNNNNISFNFKWSSHNSCSESWHKHDSTLS